MKKNKGDILFIVLLITAFGLGWYYFQNTVNDYQFQIDERDSLITNQLRREDSLRTNNTELINQLNELFKETKLDNKNEFDVSDFIYRHNAIKDSLEIYKDYLNHLKKVYGFEIFHIDYKNNREIHAIPIGRADSAFALLKVFRDRLKRNASGGFNIDVNGKDYAELVHEYNQLVKSYQKLEKQYDGLLKDLEKKGLITVDSSIRK